MKEAREVIKAWDSLEGGQHHSIKVIENWLTSDMAPTIKKLREKLNMSNPWIKNGK